MVLRFLTAMVALAAGPTDNWSAGGGRAWMNPPGNCLHSCDSHFAKYVDETREAARRGDVFAMQSYGQLLWDGQFVKEDRAAAVGWFYEAAIRGDRHSMYMLGHAFAEGKGVARDASLSAYWLKRAVEPTALGQIIP